jgi:hypothetical protein
MFIIIMFICIEAIPFCISLQSQCILVHTFLLILLHESFFYLQNLHRWKIHLTTHFTQRFFSYTFYQTYTIFILFTILTLALVDNRYTTFLRAIHSFSFLVRRKNMVPFFCLSNNTSCSICLDTIYSVFITLDTCKHSFHEVCLMDWMQHSDVCPNCRTSIK